MQTQSIVSVVAPDALAVTVAHVYAAGECLGGKLTFTGALFPVAQGAALVQALEALDAANAKVPFELVIFNANPSASTLTDAVAAVIHANDLAKVIRRVSVLASDYVSVASRSLVDIAVNKVVQNAAGQTMYAALICSAAGAGNYAAVTDLTLKLALLGNKQ